MKTKLLAKLSNKHQIRVQCVHLIKDVYSVTPLHNVGIDMDALDAEFVTYSFTKARTKQQELILDSLNKYRNSIINRILTIIFW